MSRHAPRNAPRHRSNQRAFRVQTANFAAENRECCPTSRKEGHLATCVRAPGRCRDKTGYPDRDAAMAKAKELEPTRGRMTVYRCVDCALFHMGHPRNAEEGL